MSIDKYLDRRYHLQKYNCGHFAAEVWKDLFNQDISPFISMIYAPKAERKVDIKTLRVFKRSDKPINKSLVLFHSDGGELHVGVYIRNRVLHIQSSGVRFELLETIAPFFKKVTFYYVDSLYR